MKKPPRKKLSHANFEIMDLIWDMGEAAVHEVHVELNRRRDRPVRKETVQVQMSRLESYGWLARRQVGKIYLYRALYQREETSREILRDVRRRVFGGSRADLIRCLIAEEEISDAELDRIRDMLKVQEGESPG